MVEDRIFAGGGAENVYFYQMPKKYYWSRDYTLRITYLKRGPERRQAGRRMDRQNQTRRNPAAYRPHSHILRARERET